MSLLKTIPIFTACLKQDNVIQKYVNCCEASPSQGAKKAFIL